MVRLRIEEIVLPPAELPPLLDEGVDSGHITAV